MLHRFLGGDAFDVTEGVDLCSDQREKFKQAASEPATNTGHKPQRKASAPDNFATSAAARE